jgi:hypothetical protein
MAGAPSVDRMWDRRRIAAAVVSLCRASALSSTTSPLVTAGSSAVSSAVGAVDAMNKQIVALLERQAKLSEELHGVLCEPKVLSTPTPVLWCASSCPFHVLGVGRGVASGLGPWLPRRHARHRIFWRAVVMHFAASSVATMVAACTEPGLDR